MNIYEFAMQMELEGKDYYTALAEKSKNTGVKILFNILAADEQKHYEVIKKLKDGKSVVPQTSILEDVKDMFESITKKSQGPLQITEDVLRHAIRLEEESIKLYKKYREENLNINENKAFEVLAREEQKHFFILENLLNHIVGGFVRGIESAEFQRWETELDER